jgi:chromosome segregation ATPase
LNLFLSRYVQNKELTDKLEEYLDRIGELETTNKSLSSLSKLVEQYRDKAVELERAQFEATASQELSTQEIRRLRTELETAHEGRRFLEDEIESLRFDEVLYLHH